MAQASSSRAVTRQAFAPPPTTPTEIVAQQNAMHETDMTKALILTVKDWWESQSERPTISQVHLTVGKFTCVEPAGLQFAFDAQTQNTFLAGAQLIIQETPLIAFCHPCQQEYQPEIGIQYACPICKSPMDDIRSGRELKIDRIEYREADHAPNL